MLLPDETRVKHRNFRVRRVARTTSTQDLVRRAAERGEAEGLCVVAAEQTAGRGRQQRSWQAPPGTALLCSTLVRIPGDRIAGIPFAAGLAAVDTMERTCAIAPRLKWPNDVLVDGRKLAGILVEVVPRHSPDAALLIVGIGLNRTVPSFPAGALGVSLHHLTEHPPSLTALLQHWLDALDERLEQLVTHGIAATLAQWRNRATGLGESVRAELTSGTVEGVAVDVDDSGALLLHDNHGVTHRLVAGDVHLVRR